MATIPTARMAVDSRGDRSAAITIASSTPGSASMMSTRPIAPSPNAPPRYAATRPSASPVPSPTRTTPTPAPSEMAAPCTTRVRMSRPNSSVPMRWLGDGGWSLAGTSMRIGFPVNAGPATATTNRNASRTPPTHPLAPSWIRRRDRRDRPLRNPAGGGALVSNARVEESIGHIRQHVEGREHHREQQDGALHEHVVARRERLDGQVADPGPGEHGLRDHRAAEQISGFQRRDRDDGDERVRERVPPHQPQEPQPLPPRGPRAVLMQHLEQAAAHVPRQDRHRPPGQGDGGKDQVPGRIPEAQPPLFHKPVDQ